MYYEQLRLMTQSVDRYSYDFLVFASVFCNTAPNTYVFCAQVAIVFCHVTNNTICKITLSKTMSPSIEQHDTTFLCYVKEKMKIFQPNEKTVALLLDETHLHQFFDYASGSVVDYKGGNLI